MHKIGNRAACFVILALVRRTPSRLRPDTNLCPEQRCGKRGKMACAVQTSQALVMPPTTSLNKAEGKVTRSACFPRAAAEENKQACRLDAQGNPPAPAQGPASPGTRYRADGPGGFCWLCSSQSGLSRPHGAVVIVCGHHFT